MLAAWQTPVSSPLRELAIASAELYPSYIHQLEADSGVGADYRQVGTRVLRSSGTPDEVFQHDHCIDNRRLTQALIVAARIAGVLLHERCAVHDVKASNGSLILRTAQGTFAAPHVLNAAGAWAAGIAGVFPLPVRPRKGQILALKPTRNDLIEQVVVGPDVYLVPRSDGRVIVGATVEDVGFDKRVEHSVIAQLRRSAERLCPELAEAELVEAWAGLRPGSPDDLPLLGPTSVPGYWVATGHFRDGILLTPITAQVIADLISGSQPSVDLSPFNPSRFRSLKSKRLPVA
jgi:glycine oxidase